MANTFRSTLALVSLLSLVGPHAGCGDSASDAEDLARTCTAYCSWETRCGKSETDCMSKCQKEMTPQYGYFQEAFFSAITRCYESLPCTDKSDTCFTVGIQSVAPNPVAEAAYQQCMSARAACKDKGAETFSDDVCYTAVALTSQGKDLAAACYQRECAVMSCRWTTARVWRWRSSCP